MDLNIENYSYQELLNLFQIKGNLTEDMLKKIRKTVLQTHPDKSKLHPDYYIFFSKAYTRILSMYSFQNKTAKDPKKAVYADYSFSNEEKSQIRNFVTQNKQFEKPDGFNSWFNEKYEQYNSDVTENDGYGCWLRSDEDLDYTTDMTNQDLDRKKQQLQSLIAYKEIGDFEPVAKSLNFTDLGESTNYTSDDFTDLKQAYTETVIPITQRDCDNVKQFSNMNEFVSHRNNEQFGVRPMNEMESERYFQNRESQLNEQSAFIAYKWCAEAERAEQKNSRFLSEMKQIKW